MCFYLANHITWWLGSCVGGAREFHIWYLKGNWMFRSSERVLNANYTLFNSFWVLQVMNSSSKKLKADVRMILRYPKPPLLLIAVIFLWLWVLDGENVHSKFQLLIFVNQSINELYLPSNLQSSTQVLISSSQLH